MKHVLEEGERAKVFEAAADAGRVLAFARRDPSTWPSWLCPGCGETLSHPQGVPETEEAQRCFDCAEKARPRFKPALRPLESREEELLRAGVPARFAKAAFVEPPTWPVDPRGGGARPDLQAWNGEPWCVTLGGVADGGKTMLAVELAWRAIQRRKDVQFYRAGTAVSVLFGNFGEEQARHTLQRLYTAEVLVLDEIGRGHDGKAWSRIVEILSHRHDNLLASVFTTNRRLRPAKNQPAERELSLSEEDPALFRRLEEGLLVGVREPWRRI